MSVYIFIYIAYEPCSVLLAAAVYMPYTNIMCPRRRRYNHPSLRDPGPSRNPETTLSRHLDPLGTLWQSWQTLPAYPWPVSTAVRPTLSDPMKDRLPRLRQDSSDDTCRRPRHHPRCSATCRGSWHAPTVLLRGSPACQISPSMHGWMDGCMHGWMDGRMDGCMDGWIDR